MMGNILAQSPLWGHIDSVAAIPLHPTRKLLREYNQSDFLAQGIAQQLNIPHIQGAIHRTVNNRPQRQAPTKEQRWDNVEGIFSVAKPALLQGRHLLLVDDVFTTGATIISCCEAILRAAPDCHISVATLFASKQEVGIKD
jgi:predicted amidophosphoribosyltransferase